MNEFTVPLHIQAEGGLDHILKRLAQIVEGTDSYWNKDTNEQEPRGTDWALGQNNNYFVHRVGPTTFRINTRYGRYEDEEALTQTAIWVLGLRTYQPGEFHAVA